MVVSRGMCWACSLRQEPGRPGSGILSMAVPCAGHVVSNQDTARVWVWSVMVILTPYKVGD